jgi:hypothetical protein
VQLKALKFCSKAIAEEIKKRIAFSTLESNHDENLIQLFLSYRRSLFAAVFENMLLYL